MPTNSIQRTTVAAGESETLIPGDAPWSLSVAPGAGGTATVSVTLSEPTDVGALWHTLDDAPISEAKLYMVPGPVAAIKVLATTEDADVELSVMLQ
jgi:hypothetical protein